MKWIAPLLVVLASGCECWNSPGPAPLPAQAAKPETAPPTPVRAHLHVVDAEGRPLAKMIPIATLHPNVFDAPLARGRPTDTAGRGIVLIPPDKTVFVRAWDPALRFFANNYHEVPPGPATDTELMIVTMLAGAALRVQLSTEAGPPVAEKTVRLMLGHPTLGPWWPAEADTDAAGNLYFPSLPPGRYTATLTPAGGPPAHKPNVTLNPGAETDLGPILFECTF